VRLNCAGRRQCEFDTGRVLILRLHFLVSDVMQADGAAENRESKIGGAVPDGRRRRSQVTNERKMAFGRKNEKLNLHKVL